MKAAFDKRAKEKRFRVGDYVYVQHGKPTGQFQKFQPSYHGPWVVLREKGNDNYHLADEKGTFTTAHSNRLKLAPFLDQRYELIDVSDARVRARNPDLEIELESTVPPPGEGYDEEDEEEEEILEPGRTDGNLSQDLRGYTALAGEPERDDALGLTWDYHGENI